MFNRREIIRIGAVSVLAHDMGATIAASSEKNATRADGVIFLLLQGGPSHHDLWDPKPMAPAEVRGPFSTIATSLSGIRFGELLPRSAQLAHRMTVVRSMEHSFTNHIAGTYITLTGSSNQPDADREAKAEDFPGPGAILNYLNPQPRGVPVSVSLPTWLSIPGPSNRMPGQYGGVIGAAYDPFIIAGEPQKPDFKPLMLGLPDDMSNSRLDARISLRQQLDAARRTLDDKPDVVIRERFHQTARELLAQPRFRQALELHRESDRLRDRYGRSKIGQSLLLARRLIEAGVQLVAYNEFNQHWDTHGGLQGRYKQIVPPMDQAFSALVEDLHERGLLDRTLVINTGEFGRTPTINKDAGRDHWPYAYSTVLAGGGIRSGLVHGATDSKGARVALQPVAPADILATMWTCLGIDPHTEIRDRVGRPWLVSTGRVVKDIL